VRVVSSAAELDGESLAAELLIFHVAATEPDAAESELSRLKELAQRLPKGGQAFAILSRGDLVSSVAAMQAHARVSGAIALDRLRASDLTATIARLLVGDIFGIDKVLPWGARVHSFHVGDYREKAEAVQRISSFAAAIGLRRMQRERIERCCDEMMMNALYDAPVGPDGKSPARGSSGAPLEAGDRAVVEYGCDGQRFAVSVRDRFGRFDRDTLLRYLHKCLHAEQQIDQAPGGGAGLGLYFMSRSASSLLFNLRPGAATECICVFDLESPRAEIDQIGVFQERRDAKGRVAARPPRGRRPVQRRRPEVSLEEMRTEIIPRLHAEYVRAEPAASQPRDRIAEEQPTTPLSLSPVRQWLRHRSVAIGAALSLIGLLSLVLGLSRRDGAAMAGENGRSGALSISANVPAQVTIAGTTCRNRPLPLDRFPLRDGTHTVVVESEALHLRHSFTIDVRGELVERSVRIGFVEARPGYRLRAMAGQPPVARVALPEGQRTVTLMNQTPGSWLDLPVLIRGDETVLVP
jgi:hypothetical protein